MRVTAALSLLLLALLVGPEPARAGSDLLIGVHDDSIKWTERPTPILGAMQALGLGGMRVTLEWRPGKRHLSGPDHDALRRAVAAKGYGIRTVLGVYGRAVDAPHDPAAREDYCRFVRNVLLRYGEVRDVVIWNEANSDTFWLPPESAPAEYEALLAHCWDLLHASVPGVNVLTTTASSHDPAAFIRGVGAAYRASGRQRPLFDAAGHNPYSLYPGEPPTARHEVYVGQGDYDRLVATLDPERQAAQIAAALRLAHCQPRVAAYFNFLLVDESVLGGWQSGLLWADWKRKPAFEAYRAAIAEVRSGTVDCAAVLRG
jgi:hypothetical protein